MQVGKPHKREMSSVFVVETQHVETFVQAKTLFFTSKKFFYKQNFPFLDLTKRQSDQVKIWMASHLHFKVLLIILNSAT